MRRPQFMPGLWLLALIVALAAVPIWADHNAGFHPGMAEQDLNNIKQRQAGVVDPSHPQHNNSVSNNDAREHILAENLGKAEDHLAVVTTRLRVQFESKPAWKTLQKNLQESVKTYDEARAAAMAKLGEQADFQAAAHDRVQAQQNLADARAANQGPEQLSALAATAIAAGKKVSDMQTAALNADPAVQAALAPVAAARAAVDQLRKQFEESLPGEGDWVTAKATVDSARKLVLAAQGRGRVATAPAAAPMTNMSPAKPTTAAATTAPALP